MGLAKGITYGAEHMTKMTGNEEVGLVNLVVAVPTKKSRVRPAVNKGFFFANLAKTAGNFHILIS